MADPFTKYQKSPRTERRLKKCPLDMKIQAHRQSERMIALGCDQMAFYLPHKDGDGSDFYITRRGDKREIQYLKVVIGTEGDHESGNESNKA